MYLNVASEQLVHSTNPRKEHKVVPESNKHLGEEASGKLKGTRAHRISLIYTGRCV